MGCLAFVLDEVSRNKLSTLVALLLLGLFGVAMDALSGGVTFSVSTFMGNPTITFSLVVVNVILVVSLCDGGCTNGLLRSVM